MSVRLKLDPDPAGDGGGGNGDITPVDIKALIPEEYKDKGYLKDVDSVDKLFKKLDGAETLLGKRPAGIPHVEAPPEEWDSFFKAFGRPDDVKGYELGDAANDTQYDEFIRGTFHEAGLNNKQAKVVNEKINSYLLKQKEDTAKQDSEFEALLTQSFGERKDTVIENARLLIQENAPKEFRDGVASLDNKSLVVLAGVLDKVTAKYIKEDNILDLGRSKSDGGSSPATRQAEAKRLMDLPAYKDFTLPDHEAIVAKVNALYSNL